MRSLLAQCSICMLSLWIAGMMSASAIGQSKSKVTVHEGENETIEIRIDEQPFATFNYSGSLPKPFVLPIRTASGTIVNRSLHDESDADHPHHKGLWLSIDEVNGQKFWAEKAPIVNVSRKTVHSGDARAVLQVVNEWRHGETGAVQVRETTDMTFFANRVIKYDVTFTAEQDEVIFEDTKEGLFGFRVAPSMKEKNGGTVLSSSRVAGTKDCWGKPFPWIDYSGTIDGKVVGVTLMDHPLNFRPSRYHVRDYGLFSISPFGDKAYTNGEQEAKPLHLKKGESLRLRYGAYFHDGDAGAANIPAAWAVFTQD